MDIKKTKELAEEAIEKLVSAIEQGQSATLRAYLAAMGRFHRYSLGNAMLIAMARPDATNVAGFYTWKRLGRSVRKGERGIAILAPIRRRKQVVASMESEESKPEALTRESAMKSLSTVDRAETVAGFRACFVFDIAQTDGKPLPEFARVQGEPGEMLQRLRELVANKGIILRYAEQLGGAEGLSAGGEIVIRDGLEPAEHFSTLVHELAHELLHRDGVARPKVVKETEAEAVAYAVCEGVGLAAETAAVDYIQLYDGKKETLLASLERIRGVAGEILAAVLPVTNHQRNSTGDSAGPADTRELAAEPARRAAA